MPLSSRSTAVPRRSRPPEAARHGARHKDDREALNAELVRLYRQHGTNPATGCLPMIVQLPIFLAPYHVMSEFRPHLDDRAIVLHFVGEYGLSPQLISQGAHAKLLGAPLSAAFTSSPDLLTALGVNATTVKLVALVMLLLMGATALWTQRQALRRANAQLDPRQAQLQRGLLYVMPVVFAAFGLTFPIGLLLYWLTTNVWAFGQQRILAARAPGAPAAA